MNDGAALPERALVKLEIRGLLHAADDAVGARRRGNLDAVGIAALMLEDAGEVDRPKRLLEGRAVLHHHHGRLDQVEQVLQLDVKIGRAHV